MFLLQCFETFIENHTIALAYAPSYEENIYISDVARKKITFYVWGEHYLSVGRFPDVRSLRFYKHRSRKHFWPRLVTSRMKPIRLVSEG